MPNWCSTDIEIIGTREEMDKLAAIVNEAKEPGFLETICPVSYTHLTLPTNREV